MKAVIMLDFNRLNLRTICINRVCASQLSIADITVLTVKHTELKQYFVEVKGSTQALRLRL